MSNAGFSIIHLKKLKDEKLFCINGDFLNVFIVKQCTNKGMDK